MEYQWLNKKEENNKLIVFFNGWAMNETPVSHLASENYDILMFFDYRKLNDIISTLDLTKYVEKNLVAFSMGVYAANKFAKILNSFDRKVAVNGTNKIVDNNFGIPEKIYKITVKFLNEDSLDKFIKNMFKGGEINPEIKITRTLEELKEELIEIQKITFEDEIKYDKALISNDDRIIPTKNQVAFWKNWGNGAKFEIIDGTHCPFKNYNSWREILC